MIFTGSFLSIVDNTGVKEVRAIRLIKPHSMYSLRPAKVGNILLVSLRKLKGHKKLKKGDIHIALLVRTVKRVKRIHGDVGFFENSAILLNKKHVPIGNKVKGPVPQELRDRKYVRVLSMSTFVF